MVLRLRAIVDRIQCSECGSARVGSVISANEGLYASEDRRRYLGELENRNILCRSGFLGKLCSSQRLEAPKNSAEEVFCRTARCLNLGISGLFDEQSTKCCY